jgi:hypothetical protein
MSFTIKSLHSLHSLQDCMQVVKFDNLKHSQHIAELKLLLKQVRSLSLQIKT